MHAPTFVEGTASRAVCDGCSAQVIVTKLIPIALPAQWLCPDCAASDEHKAKPRVQVRGEGHIDYDEEYFTPIEETIIADGLPFPIIPRRS